MKIKPNLVVEGDFEATSFSERHALASPGFATVVSMEDTLWQILTSGGNLFPIMPIASTFIILAY